MKNSVPFLFFCIFGIYNPEFALSQDNPLAIFDRFVGNEWIGHFQDSEDSNLVHYIAWGYDLDKKIVKAIKTVPELNFEMTTTFYYDFEKKEISFISFMNKDLINRGVVKQENGLIILIGSSYFPSGHNEFKTTFEINRKGELIDRFFKLKNESWSLGHHIEYRVHH